MVVPEISNQLINNIEVDQYGRVSAVLVLNKPVGITSHDMVDDVRKVLRTRKVGHAGALDPFADGVLILLVGRYTKYTQAVINFDKAYKAGVVLGIKTITQDPEGEILEDQEVGIQDLPEANQLEQDLQTEFMPGYEQIVPIFSSVKVSGNKLRVLARSAQEIKFHSKTEVEFVMPAGDSIVAELPSKEVAITDLSLENLKSDDKHVELTIHVSCSKGTYIRQLAQDIGEFLGYPAYLQSLTRTKVGMFSLEDAISIEELYGQGLAAGIKAADFSELKPRLKSMAQNS